MEDVKQVPKTNIRTKTMPRDVSMSLAPEAHTIKFDQQRKPYTEEGHGSQVNPPLNSEHRLKRQAKGSGRHQQNNSEPS